MVEQIDASWPENQRTDDVAWIMIPQCDASDPNGHQRPEKAKASDPPSF